MESPWKDLPKIAPFILAEDNTGVSDFNTRAKGTAFEIMLDQMPQPYIGDPYAPVLLLNLNPGYAPDASSHLTQKLFAETARINLDHVFGEYPFYPLDPALAGSPSGHEWWSLILGPLIRASGRPAQEVSRKVFCAEYFPYHSVSYKWGEDLLPSQRYTVHLVEDALNRGAQVVIMRSRKLWEHAVPALIHNPNVYVLKNPQRTFISEGNMDEGAFKKVTQLVRE